jgi:hypothetical protein
MPRLPTQHVLAKVHRLGHVPDVHPVPARLDRHHQRREGPALALAQQLLLPEVEQPQHLAAADEQAPGKGRQRERDGVDLRLVQQDEAVLDQAVDVQVPERSDVGELIR